MFGLMTILDIIPLAASVDLSSTFGLGDSDVATLNGRCGCFNSVPVSISVSNIVSIEYSCRYLSDTFP